MKTLVTAIAAIVALTGPAVASAPAETPAEVAANKALVVKFWNECFDRHDLACAESFLVEDYIQHNPTVATGRAGFREAFSKFWPKPLAPEQVKTTKFEAVIGEGDLVQLVQRLDRPEPADPTKTYASYWFDLFRVKNGKIVEHWDGATKPERK